MGGKITQGLFSQRPAERRLLQRDFRLEKIGGFSSYLPFPMQYSALFVRRKICPLLKAGVE